MIARYFVFATPAHRNSLFYLAGIRELQVGSPYHTQIQFQMTKTPGSRVRVDAHVRDFSRRGATSAKLGNTLQSASSAVASCLTSECSVRKFRNWYSVGRTPAAENQHESPIPTANVAEQGPIYSFMRNRFRGEDIRCCAAVYWHFPIFYPLLHNEIRSSWLDD